jgi:predicted RNA-binding protein with RPS1 domain
MSKINVGDIVKGQVTGVTKYGVFMSFEDEYSGLVHISEVSNKYVKDLKEKFMVGDVIRAKVIDIDKDKNHLKLSIKEVNPKVKSSKSKIEESGLGFELLETNLPIWVEKRMNELTK